MTHTTPDPSRQTVHIVGDEVDIELIQEAIRQRIQQRRAAARPPVQAELDRATADRLAQLDDWNFPRSVWSAMWPPQLEPWNLDDDYPLASHRRGVGAVLVVAKRCARAFLRVALRPILQQQVRINHTLALITRSLADELAREQLRVRALEQRLSRVSMVAREARGDLTPLVTFEPTRSDA